MTLREVQRCTKDGIRINTFMLEDNFYLREFVERMMQMNRGRAFFTTPETLGDYVLVDFLDQRRAATPRRLDCRTRDQSSAASVDSAATKEMTCPNPIPRPIAAERRTSGVSA